MNDNLYDMGDRVVLIKGNSPVIRNELLSVHSTHIPMFENSNTDIFVVKNKFTCKIVTDNDKYFLEQLKIEIMDGVVIPIHFEFFMKYILKNTTIHENGIIEKPLKAVFFGDSRKTILVPYDLPVSPNNYTPPKIGCIYSLPESQHRYLCIGMEDGKYYKFLTTISNGENIITDSNNRWGDTLKKFPHMDYTVTDSLYFRKDVKKVKFNYDFKIIFDKQNRNRIYEIELGGLEFRGLSYSTPKEVMLYKEDVELYDSLDPNYIQFISWLVS